MSTTWPMAVRMRSTDICGLPLGILGCNLAFHPPSGASGEAFVVVAADQPPVDDAEQHDQDEQRPADRGAVPELVLDERALVQVRDDREAGVARSTDVAGVAEQHPGLGEDLQSADGRG